MQKINSESSLNSEILRLENLQKEEGQTLKEHFLVAYEGVKPVNLILSTFREITASHQLKTNILSTTVGLAAGYLSKLLFERGTRNPVRKVLGNALMFGMVNLVTKNPEIMKSLGRGFMKLIPKKREKRSHPS